MALNKKLDLSFKGNRDYLHGTDIFNQTLMWLEELHAPLTISAIDFSFHRLAKHALTAYSTQQPDLGDPVAVCSYRFGVERAKTYLYETSDDVLGRYLYAEDDITQNFQVSSELLSGVLYGDPTFSDLEIWVALTKALHQRALPELKGKWLFVRGRFPCFLHKTVRKSRSLRIVSNFQNCLTRTELCFDGEIAGEIYFSLIQEH